MRIDKKIIACLLLVIFIGAVIPAAKAQAFGFGDIQNQIIAIGQKINQLIESIGRLWPRPVNAPHCGDGQTQCDYTPANTPDNSTSNPSNSRQSSPETVSAGCVLKDKSCCRGNDCAVPDFSCLNGNPPRLDGCDASCQPIVKCEAPCVTEGGEVYDNTSDKCCAGLAAVPGNVIQYDTGECKNNDYYKICLKCGDGICSGPENDCNCPQDCKTRLGCVKEGEIFSDSSRHCCAGLQTDYSVKPCSDGKVPCYIFPLRFSCKKPSSLTCDQECKSKGYKNGYCGGPAFNQGNRCNNNDWQLQESDEINNFGCVASAKKINQPSDSQNGDDNWGMCCCSGFNPGTCIKEKGTISGGDQDSVCCAGLEKVQTMTGWVCKDPAKAKDCADDGELVYNDRSMFGSVSGPKKCCDPDAGIEFEAFTDGGAAKGWCVKNWNNNCGNGRCDSGEDAMSCPWDCKNTNTSTCDDFCASSGYGNGRCVTNSKCTANENGMGGGIGLGDCSLYGLPKTTSKICCCKPFDRTVNCFREGEIFDSFNSSTVRHNWGCCPGLNSQDLTSTADPGSGDISSIIMNDNYRTASICVSPNGGAMLECKKPANGKEGWYYSKSEKLIIEAKCNPTLSTMSKPTSCKMKDNNCDWGSGSMTYDCRDKGGGNFVISGCDKLCQPYGKCVNPNGNVVNIPAQSP